MRRRHKPLLQFPIQKLRTDKCVGPSELIVIHGGGDFVEDCVWKSQRLFEYIERAMNFLLGTSKNLFTMIFSSLRLFVKHCSHGGISLSKSLYRKVPGLIIGEAEVVL